VRGHVGQKSTSQRLYEGGSHVLHSLFVVSQNKSGMELMLATQLRVTVVVVTVNVVAEGVDVVVIEQKSQVTSQYPGFEQVGQKSVEHWSLNS